LTLCALRFSTHETFLMNRMRSAGVALAALTIACAKDAPPPADTATVAPTPPAPVTPAVDAAPATFKVRFETSKGPIVIEAHRDWAPNGVDRFYQLVQQGFYDDVRFFRVVPGFVVQFGMHGDPATHAKWTAQPLIDDPVTQPNRRGTVTFAKTGMPNSRTTQIFINLQDNSSMLNPPAQPGFAPFGEVVEGMSVVDKLYSGYGGEPSDHQPRIAAEGNAFLNASSPKLDFIRTAKVVK
jgi:peptidyl-prolyl cis-trans isomerase A (cyclophilin A)